MPNAALPSDDTPAPGDESPLELTVVLPCLNEAEPLATCVRKALGSVAAHEESQRPVAARSLCQ